MDMVAGIIDARIPVPPAIRISTAIVGAGPGWVSSTGPDQAEPAGNRAWRTWFQDRGLYAVLEPTRKTRRAEVDQVSITIKEALKDQLPAGGKGTGRPYRPRDGGGHSQYWANPPFINKIARKRGNPARRGINPASPGQPVVAVDAGLVSTGHAGHPLAQV